MRVLEREAARRSPSARSPGLADQPRQPLRAAGAGQHAERDFGQPILPPPCRAMRMSAAIATSSPPPTVWPLSAAITSFGVCSSRFSVSLACRQK